MSNKLQVLLDISPITSRASRRTGLARVAIELARALVESGDVELHCCAWGSVYASFDAPRFLEAHPEIGGWAGKNSRISQWLGQSIDRCVEEGTSVPPHLIRLTQIWNRLRNPVSLSELRVIDCVHSTYSRIHRQIKRSKIPRLLTIHDLTPLKLSPSLTNQTEVRMCKRLVQSLTHEDRIVCVSEATRRDVLDLTCMEEGQVSVIPNGVDLAVFRPVSEDCVQKVLSELNLTEGPFLFSYSSLAPHKNLDLILKAWPVVVKRVPGALLALAGGKGDAVEGRLSGLSDSVKSSIRLLGRVSDESIAALCTACNGFLFPSFYEGFGLPVLEAMACGARVLSSNTSSLPEVCGDFAQMLPPDDANAWIEGMVHALQSNPPATQRENTIEHASQFTWERCALRHRDLYQELAAGR